MFKFRSWVLIDCRSNVKKCNINHNLQKRCRLAKDLLVSLKYCAIVQAVLYDLGYIQFCCVICVFVQSVNNWCVKLKIIMT